MLEALGDAHRQRPRLPLLRAEGVEHPYVDEPGAGRHAHGAPTPGTRRGRDEAGDDRAVRVDHGAALPVRRHPGRRGQPRRVGDPAVDHGDHHPGPGGHAAATQQVLGLEDPRRGQGPAGPGPRPHARVVGRDLGARAGLGGGRPLLGRLGLLAGRCGPETEQGQRGEHPAGRRGPAGAPGAHAQPDPASGSRSGGQSAAAWESGTPWAKSSSHASGTSTGSYPP